MESKFEKGITVNEDNIRSIITDCFLAMRGVKKVEVIKIIDVTAPSLPSPKENEK